MRELSLSVKVKKKLDVIHQQHLWIERGEGPVSPEVNRLRWVLALELGGSQDGVKSRKAVQVRKYFTVQPGRKHISNRI